jgi:short-subunit dehydrogenase
VATKHAVVGLSMALRSEAVPQGVGVLVVCPAAVETPILDKGAVGSFAGRDYFLKTQGGKAYDADRLARDTLRAIDRNTAILVKPTVAHAQWLFARAAPVLMNRLAMRFVAGERSRQTKGSPSRAVDSG